MNSSYRRFFLLHLIAIALPCSLFFGPTASIWSRLDISCFRHLNSYVQTRPIQQIFWSLANIKITDIFGATALLGMFLLYVFETKGNERRKRLAQLLYTLLWFEISILFCKQLLTPICMHLGWTRHGPSSVLSHVFFLSNVVPWEKIKDSSLFCFPADHGTIAFQWSAFLWFFAGWQRGIVACFLSCFLVLPRLISGAHWLSDVVVGSFSILLIMLAWAFYSPIYKWTFSFFSMIFRYNPQPEKES